MLKRVFFRFWPFFLIFLVWLLFSNPYLIHNKVPFPSDYAVNFFPPWSAYHVYDGPIKNNAMPDVITQIYPWRFFTIESWMHGEIPMWNPYSFAGTPHLADYQSAVFSPFNLLFFILPFVDAWSLLILLQPLLAGLCMYLFARSLYISKRGSVMSALGFMFCGFITTWMDYGTLAYAILFLPLALFAVEKFFYYKENRYILLLTCTFPFSFFSGHFQTSLYMLLFSCVYILYKTWQTKKIWSGVILYISVICGVLLSMPQILPSLEFYNQSLRSVLFQQIEAIPLAYLPAFLAPDIFGNPVTRNDLFGHYAEWNGYIGLLPIMLGFYGVFRKRNSFTLFLFISSIVVLLLAFATPLLQVLIYLHIPVLSTSAASRIIVLFSFIFVILSGFGFDAILQDLQNRKNKVITLWLSAFSILFVFLWTIVTLKLYMPIDKIAIAKQNLKLPTLFFCIIATICFGTLLSTKLNFPQKKNIEKQRKFTIILLVSFAFLLLTIFDMVRFATKWQPFDAREHVFPPTKVTTLFHPNMPFERIMGDDGAEVSMYNHLPSIEGYDPLYIKRYGEFVSSLDGIYHESSRSVVSFPKKSVYTPNAMHLLNVAYILQKKTDYFQPWGFPFTNYASTQFDKIYDDGHYQVFKNIGVLPHVFFAQNYIIKTSPQGIISTLFAPTTHLNSTLVLEEDPHIMQGGVSGTAKITNYTNNTISIIANTNKNALLYLSEVYYPGWKAYVDGKETPIYRTDYTFRSIVVPAGTHSIFFSYEPRSIVVGFWLFIFGGIVTLVISFIPKQKLLQ